MKKIYAVTFGLMMLAGAGAQAGDMTRDEANKFLKKEDYTSCKVDDECILTTDLCSQTVSIHKDKQTDFDLASKIMGRYADCPTPKKYDYYSGCQEGKCTALIRKDKTSKPK